MLHCYMDHMAIVAPSLAVGAEYVQQTLGVTLQAGGAHPRMGTHNALLKLGEKFYLEVIAIDPQAPRPDRPRWFELDAPDPQRPIRLATWIARTDDVHAALAAASSISLGEIEPMSRGAIHWQITIPRDGSLPMQGIAPTLIEWPAGVHPASTLPASGCALERLEGFHPEAKKINDMLDAIGFEGDFSVSALPSGARPYLVAHIRTLNGMRLLSAPGFSPDTDTRG